MKAISRTINANLAGRRRMGSTGGPRDSQRGKLYGAERRAFEIDKTTHALRELSKCQAFVNRITSAAWFVRRWGRHHIDVTHSGGRRASLGGYGTLHLLTTHRNPAVICHELAHCLVSFRRYAAHGPEYARTYLTLVRYVMGSDAAASLARAFRECGVKVAPARKELDGRGVFRERAKRELTEDQRDAARVRLAALRARHTPAAVATPSAPPSRALDVALAIANSL